MCNETFNRPEKLTCWTCQESFDTKRGLVHHQLMDHRPTGQQSPFKSPPWTDETGAVVDQAIEREYDMHRAVIMAPHSEGQVQSTFNYPLPNQVDMDELMELAACLPSEFLLWIHMQMISNVSHLQDFENKLRALNLMDYVLAERPNTKYKITIITNVVFTVTSTYYLLEDGTINLPDYIKKSKCIVGFHANPTNWEPYRDQK